MVRQGGLFLKQTSCSEGGHGGDQPLNSPQLDRLPVEGSADAEEYADGQSADHAKQAQQKSDRGRQGEAEALTEGGKLGTAGNFRGG